MTTIKTPLPRKIPPIHYGDDKTQNVLITTLNQYHDYLAELTEVVNELITPISAQKEEKVSQIPKLRSVEVITGEKVRDSLSFIEKLSGKEIVELENAIDDALDLLTTDRSHIAAVLIEGLEEKREEVVGDLEMNINIKKIAKNKALDTAIALVKATLDVTSEEK